MAEAQTVLWERMLAAKRRNSGRILVVDPRKSPTVRQGADLHLQIRIGTNIALMNGLIHLLVAHSWIKRDFIDASTVGFPELERIVREYPPGRVSEICGIPASELEQAAEWIGTTDRMVSTVLQGFYQSVEATASTSLVNTVHLIRGAIGRRGAGPLPMAGQPSAMCNRETGAGGTYPACRNPLNPAHMKELCEIWNIDFQTFHAKTPTDILTMLKAAERGQVEFMWVIGTNPLVSLPDQNRTQRLLGKLFLVVQDPFVDTDSVALADIYFPAAMWGEKAGCVNNADRSINLLQKAVEPPGEARTDFDVIVDVARRLGLQDRDGRPLISFREPQDAFSEWRRVTKGRPCDYSGVTYEVILEHGAIRWPFNEQHPLGSERLYEDLKFWTDVDDCESYGMDFLTDTHLTREEYQRIDARGRAILGPARWRMQPNPASAEYPFVLSSGRVVYHFHTRTKTARSRALNRRAPYAYVEMRPDDAEQLGIGFGDLVEVTSPHGVWEGPAMVVDTVRRGELFIPFHYGWGRQAANQHTWYPRDAMSRQPQLKSAPVAIRRKSFGKAEQWLCDRYDDLAGKSIEPYAARTIGGTVNEEVFVEERNHGAIGK